MPEIKHTFTAGRMNKDLDERLVPNGQYRDAMNIQVRTTDGDAAGTVQNLQGNELVGSSYLTQGYDQKKSKMVASVADEKNDSSYFFSAAPIPEGGIENIPHTTVVSEVIWIDSITEFKSAPTFTATPVFVDKFAITSTVGLTFFTFVNTDNWSILKVLDATKYRVGMKMTLQNVNGNHLVFEDGAPGAEIIKIDTDTNELFFNEIQNINLFNENQSGNITNTSCVKFIHPERVLEFDYNKIISGINIIDDLLFWTDNKNEPKKINIKRSKRGTTNNSTHTQLYVNNPIIDDLVIISGEATSPETLNTADVKKEHITVIKKKPIMPPHLHMSKTTRVGVSEFNLTNYSFVDEDVVPSIPNENSFREIAIGDTDSQGGFPNEMQIFIDDIFIFTDNSIETSPVVVRAKVNDISNGVISFKMIFVDTTISDQNLNWFVQLEQRKPIFESKFGRFAYRYKYEDNEYSAFSPWSELAFLPSSFSYIPSKGYNEGMTNNLRSLVIKNFIPDNSLRPVDAKEVEILWKTTDDQNVYIVKTIKRFIDNEWNTTFSFDGGGGINFETTGVITITSEMIHRALPSNQLLRGWDNVPKKALAQEITASRLIYGNYEQGYDIKDPIGLKQSIVSDNVPLLIPRKSVKSIRSYRFGAVFGDEYGRETPVIANGYIDSLNTAISGDISLEKSLAAFQNKFELQQNWEDIGVDPPDFLEYVKYYVKETSNEYYNLVMDRWYDAADGNIWISFPSADRNKIDEETYLILKNEHGSQVPVDEEARFRVIAIANEAPDYVKTSNRRFSAFGLNMEQVYSGGNTATGNPDELANKNRISLNLREITTLPASQTDLKARIVGEYVPGTGNNFSNAASNNVEIIKVFSPFINISSITAAIFDEQNGGISEPGNLNLERPFTSEEANMHSKLVALGYGGEISLSNIDDPSSDDFIRYNIQLVSRNLENLPEFDGRFFVKIEKTDTVSKRLLIEEPDDYTVIDSFDISFISNDFENPANNSNDNAALMSYESSTYADYGEPGEFNEESELANFATAGNDEATESFWAWYESKIASEEASSLFIDNTKAFNPAYSYFVRTFGGAESTEEFDYFSADQMVSFNNALDEVSDFEPNKPCGLGKITNNLNNNSGVLSIQAADTNNLNFLCISTLNTGGGFSTSEEAVFQNFAQRPEALFRFRDDPNQEVYCIQQVVLPGFESVDVEDFFNVDLNFTDGTMQEVPIALHRFVGSQMNFSPDGEPFGTRKYRKTIFIPFVRINPETGQKMLDKGVDISVWDPRGVVQHNGINTLNIEFLERVNNDDLIKREIVSNNACWETEPKKDIGLDIYYEASHAIPMYLKTNNIESFVQGSIVPDNASKVAVEKRQLITNFGNNVNNVEVPRIFNTLKVNRVDSDNIINVSQINSNSPFVPSSTNILQPQDNGQGFLQVRESRFIKSYIFINDIVSFSNNNGTLTRSKILDHIEITSDGQALPSFRTIKQGNSFNYTYSTNLDGDIGLANIKMVSTDAVDLTVGMEVRAVNGNYVQRGTMVIDIITVAQIGATFILLNRSLLNTGVDFQFEFIKTTGSFSIDKNVWKYPVRLGWFNCYSFGNGVESDRIRDDFNAPQIDNGCRVSSTFLEYGQERITNGLIYSGLYNSTSSVNNLNEFNMAEKITKNLNSTYGSVQAMKTRDTDVVVFTQDKVLKVLANKDAVFNADGNPQLTATNRVLGTAIPFAGDYGISNNPESLASDQYRIYFSDKQRGAVLRLSADGLTPISDIGVKPSLDNLRTAPLCLSAKYIL